MNVKKIGITLLPRTGESLIFTKLALSMLASININLANIVGNMRSYDNKRDDRLILAKVAVKTPE